jgi:sodium transport system permease protein
MSNTILTVFKKEIKDLYRDKKTIIVSLLIPLLLFPVIFGVIGKSMTSSKDTVQNNLKIALVDKGNSNLSKFIEGQKNIKIEKSKDIKGDINAGKIYLAIELPKDFDENVSAENTSDLKLTYDNSSQNSETAYAMINSMIDAYSKQIINNRLAKRGINTSILTPIKVDNITIVKEDEGVAKMMLSLMLPLMLVIYSVTGPLSSAIDLGVGEKERGTLEPLLTTRSGRLSLLWGKFLAITIVGLMTTIATMVGIFIAMKQNSSSFGSSTAMPGIGISPEALIIIGILIVFLTMAFGALELAISIYARSFKEASTYTGPLTIIAFIPAYATYMLDAKNIPIMYFNIPVANVVCVLKELIAGIYNYNHIAITSVWIVVYVAACILFARFMFSREEVIFRT